MRCDLRSRCCRFLSAVQNHDFGGGTGGEFEPGAGAEPVRHQGGSRRLAPLWGEAPRAPRALLYLCGPGPPHGLLCDHAALAGDAEGRALVFRPVPPHRLDANISARARSRRSQMPWLTMRLLTPLPAVHTLAIGIATNAFWSGGQIVHVS